MRSYYAIIKPSYDLVILSSNMIADCGTDEYRCRYGSVLAIGSNLYHGYCSSNVNYSYDYPRMSMTLVENGQCHFYYVNDHASEHLQYW